MNYNHNSEKPFFKNNQRNSINVNKNSVSCAPKQLSSLVRTNVWCTFGIGTFESVNAQCASWKTYNRAKNIIKLNRNSFDNTISMLHHNLFPCSCSDFPAKCSVINFFKHNLHHLKLSQKNFHIKSFMWTIVREFCVRFASRFHVFCIFSCLLLFLVLVQCT